MAMLYTSLKLTIGSPSIIAKKKCYLLDFLAFSLYAFIRCMYNIRNKYWKIMTTKQGRDKDTLFFYILGVKIFEVLQVDTLFSTHVECSQVLPLVQLFCCFTTILIP